MNLLSPFPLCTTKLCAPSSWGTGARKAGGYACSPCREEHSLANSPHPACRPVQLYLVTRRHTSFLDIFLWVLPLGRVPAAAAAKSLQSCPTLCDPIDGSPPGSPVPGILQARTLEWVAISFSNAWKWNNKVKSLSRVRLPATPWTAAYQAPPSMRLSRQEYWSGLP